MVKRTAAILRVAGFFVMKLKLDEAGNVVVQDGKPVYVHDDGKEVAFDAQAAFDKVTELNNEAKGYRLKAKDATELLAKFEGIDDPAAAKKALDIVKNLEQKKLIDAGEVESLKKQISEAYEAKITEAQDIITKQGAHIYKLEVTNRFTQSPFVKDRLNIPADMVEAKFGANFKIEDGRVVAYQGDNRILSRQKPGEVAEFDEALEILVDSYSQKESILKGSGGSGGGAPPSGGGGGQSGSLKRSAMSEQDKSKFISEHGLEKFKQLLA